MKSIKPGRGPSMMGGIMSLLMGLFGVIWTVMALDMGGGIFALFGVVFIIIAIVQAVYNFKNATGKNRYSAFDITDGSEESDPLNDAFGFSGAQESEPPAASSDTGSAFCPYCGTAVEGDFEFCNKCGKRLP